MTTIASNMPLFYYSIFPIFYTITPMKVLLFGSRGYLGQQFLQLYPNAEAPSSDIADPAAVRAALDASKPDVVINCAGKTGTPNVDWCEDHKEETVRANVTGPLILLEECLKRGIHLTHMSSGCIYTGDNGGKGFIEEDPPNFSGSFYSRTKAWSDQILKDFPVLVLRLRMPFDGSQSPRNLLMKLKKYHRVLDEKNSLTYIPDLMKVAKVLIQKRATGVFNVVNEGPISPFEVMEMYKKMVDPSHTFERLTIDQLSEVVKAGRSNCVLSTEKLYLEHVHMLTVTEALTEAFSVLKK